MGANDADAALAAHEAAIQGEATRLKQTRVTQRAARPDVAFALTAGGDQDAARRGGASLARKIMVFWRWLRDREQVAAWMHAVTRLPLRLRQLDAQVEGLRQELVAQTREVEALRGVVAGLERRFERDTVGASQRL